MSKINKVFPPETLSNDSRELFEVLNNETNNVAVVLIAGAALEKAVITLLARFMIEDDKSKELLESPKSPLGTFSACVDVAFCFGLIPEHIHRNLKKIGEIRNRFAHSHLKLTFADQSINALCKNLTLPPCVDANGQPIMPSPHESVYGNNPRNWFTAVTIHLHSVILLLALGTDHIKKHTGFSKCEYLRVGG